MMADVVTRFEADEGVSRANFNSRIDEMNQGLAGLKETAEAAKAITDTKGQAGGLAILDTNKKIVAEQASSRIISVTANRTLALTDAGCFFNVNSTSAITITIPLDSSVAFPTGTEIEFCQYNTGTVTFAKASGVTIRSAGGAVMIAERYGCVTLKKLGANNWLLAGMLG